MSKEISLASLSVKDRAKLLKELEAQQKSDNERIKGERQKYKATVDKKVRAILPVLQKVSKSIADAKRFTYKNLEQLIKAKTELYDREDDQFSHSFSTLDGNTTIIVGSNVIDGWDDTVNVGIGKVMDFLKTMVKDKDSKDLVETVTKLLSKDNKGNLKASRVLQLKQFAEKRNNKELTDAINIIQDAYRPVRSKEFVRCIIKDDKGEAMILPLSITEAETKTKTEGD